MLLLDSAGKILISSQAGTGKLVQLDPSLLERLLAQPDESLVFSGTTHREVIGVAEVAGGTRAYYSWRSAIEAEVYAAWSNCVILFLALVGALVLIVAAVAFRDGSLDRWTATAAIGAADRIAGRGF